MAKRSYVTVLEWQHTTAVFLTSTIFGGMAVFLGWIAKVTYWFAIPIGCCIFIFALFCFGFVLGDTPSTFDPKRENELLNELRGEERQLGLLLELNRQQVLRYHDIVTKQAGQSFRAGQLAAAAGLVVIGACLWLGFAHQGADVKWFSGAIAGTATAVAGYINRTYMRMYEKSIEQLSEYFDQPVVTGYYLTAERMAKVSLGGDLQRRIVESVLDTAMYITTKRRGPKLRSDDLSPQMSTEQDIASEETG